MIILRHLVTKSLIVALMFNLFLQLIKPQLLRTKTRFLKLKAVVINMNQYIIILELLYYY